MKTDRTGHVPEREANQEREIRALKLSVVLYVVVVALKLAAYFFTDVMALLAEALHTLSDIFVSGFLLVAALWSRQPADEEHPYGHGRAQYAGALVAATLFLSFTSFELYKEAIPRLFRNEPTVHSNVLVAIAVLVASMLVALFPLVSLLRQRNRGAAAHAQLLELVNDQLGLVAALVGTLFVLLGFPKADPIATIAVATIIAVNGAKLFWENLSFLLGRAPDAAVVTQISACASAIEGVLRVTQLGAEVVSSDAIRVHLHVEVRRGLAIEEGDRIAHETARAIKALQVGVAFVSVHVDPSSAEPTEAGATE